MLLDFNVCKYNCGSVCNVELSLVILNLKWKLGTKFVQAETFMQSFLPAVKMKMFIKLHYIKFGYQRVKNTHVFLLLKIL